MRSIDVRVEFLTSFCTFLNWLFSFCQSDHEYESAADDSLIEEDSEDELDNIPQARDKNTDITNEVLSCDKSKEETTEGGLDLKRNKIIILHLNSIFLVGL